LAAAAAASGREQQGVWQAVPGVQQQQQQQQEQQQCVGQSTGLQHLCGCVRGKSFGRSRNMLLKGPVLLQTAVAVLLLLVMLVVAVRAEAGQVLLLLQQEAVRPQEPGCELVQQQQPQGQQTAVRRMLHGRRWSGFGANSSNNSSGSSSSRAGAQLQYSERHGAAATGRQPTAHKRQQTRQAVAAVV
jgi:hypothetical protein